MKLPLLALLLTTAVVAAAADSAPVLVSRTGGGGGTWADLAELEAAATKGEPRALNHLGDMLVRGDGVPKDEARGLALLERAARQGQGGAAFRLGMLLTHGEGGAARDPARALAYFRAAAAAGEAEAFFNLGAAHANGTGVRRNYAEALGWLIVARERGVHAEAERQLREQIKAYPRWIETGERRAREIAAEFKDRAPADFLPPAAPLDRVFDALRPAAPAAP
jgi:TPR repeat protein